MPENYGGHVYVLVRGDLPPPQRSVQAIHAAVEATRLGLIPPEIQHPHLVLCKARNEHDLLKQADYLSRCGIKYALFIEPDIGNQHTALATQPISGEQRRLLKKFQLVKE